MKTVKISNECMQHIKISDVNYFLNEMLGMIEYSFAKSINDLPIETSKLNCAIQIENDTYDNIISNFTSIIDINKAVELLLWTYMLNGGK